MSGGWRICWQRFTGKCEYGHFDGRGFQVGAGRRMENLMAEVFR